MCAITLKLPLLSGRVGSGKSSLVNALLGEMERQSGTVAIGGQIAYVAQQAWIINSSVKSNILLGKPFDEARWKESLRACSLEADLEV